MPESVADQMLCEEDTEIEAEAALTTASGLIFTPLDPAWPQRRDRMRQELDASQSRHLEAEASLAAECQQLEASLGAAREDLAACRHDLLLASRRERDARSELSWLHMTALEPARQRVAELEQRLEASEKSRQRAEADLRQALESTSWRLTAPLRTVADWLRGKRSPALADIDHDRPL